MITIKQRFIKFLKDNNAYEQYMHNFKIHRTINKELVNSNKFTPKEFFINTFCGDFFAYAFFWKETKEGFNYWCRLDSEWWRIIMREGLNWQQNGSNSIKVT